MSIFTKKENPLIGISVGLDGLLEVVHVNKETKTIDKYAQKLLKYDFSTREIVDYIELETIIKDIFEEIGYSPKKVDVVMTLPSVFLGFNVVPSFLADEQIQGSLLSEIEQVYLFRKTPPVLSWFLSEKIDKENKKICYSAIQESVVNTLKEIFERLGVHLVSIENSYSSMIKTIFYCGINKEEVNSNQNWNILLINENSYSIFSFLGNKLLDFYEDPVPIKSFNESEVYDAISSVASSNLQNYPAEKLFIISKVNEISSEILASKLSFGGKIKCLDKNKYAEGSFMDVDYSVLPNLVPMISLEVVGSAVCFYNDFPINFNFLGTTEKKEEVDLQINIGGAIFDLTPSFIKILIVSIAIFIFIIFFSINIFLKKINETKINEITQTQAKIEQLKQEIGLNENKQGIIDILSALTSINMNNKNAILYFNSLGKNIPTNLWIEYFYTNADGSVGIIGKSTSSEDIYRFFKDTKESVGTSDIIISKLKFADDIYSTTKTKKPYSLYSFELTNSQFNSMFEKRVMEIKNQKANPTEGEKIILPIDEFIPPELLEDKINPENGSVSISEPIPNPAGNLPPVNPNNLTPIK